MTQVPGWVAATLYAIMISTLLIAIFVDRKDKKR